MRWRELKKTLNIELCPPHVGVYTHVCTRTHKHRMKAFVHWILVIKRHQLSEEILQHPSETWPEIPYGSMLWWLEWLLIRTHGSVLYVSSESRPLNKRQAISQWWVRWGYRWHSQSDPIVFWRTAESWKKQFKAGDTKSIRSYKHRQSLCLQEMSIFNPVEE